MSNDIKINLHSGHRERMYTKVDEGHVSSLTDVELLEMILYGVIRQKNTNELSHAILDKFGSYEELFNADVASLKEIDGVGKSASAFLTVLGEIYRRTDRGEEKERRTFFSVEQMGNYFVKSYARENKESVRLLLLDGNNRLIACKTVHEGTVMSSNISIRNLIKAVLDAQASRVVVAHNHPFGGASPSDDDIVLTRTIRRALSEIEVDMLEHILVAGDRYMPLVAYMTRAAELTYDS